MEDYKEYLGKFSGAQIDELLAQVPSKAPSNNPAFTGTVTVNGRDLSTQSGVYILKSDEKIEDAPDWATVVIDPDEEAPALELTATFADGTTTTFKVYGEAVV